MDCLENLKASVSNRQWSGAFIAPLFSKLQKKENMRDKRNKIIIFIMLVCMFITSLPINVLAEEEWSTFAVSKNYNFVYDTMTSTEHEFTMKYYHPEGFPEVILLRKPTGLFYLYFFEKDGQYICNDSGYGQGTTANVRIKFISLEEVYNYIFVGKYETAQCEYIDAYGDLSDTKNQIYASSTELLNINPGADHAGHAWYNGNKQHIMDIYSDWYFDQNGTPPQPDLDSSEYMKGNYYAIMSQPIETKDITGGGGGTNIDTGLHITSKFGKVETVDDITLSAKDGVFLYVVISTEKQNNHTITPSVFENLWDTLKDIFLLQMIGEQQTIMNIINEDKDAYEVREERYPHLNHRLFFYSEEEKINRYYFSSLTEASKFVLYGTAGAKYQYKEEDLTNYGFGYGEVMYNNYDLEGYPENKIPEGKYSLGKTKTILRWHEENVYEREYLLINYDYFPAASAVGTDHVLRISPILKPTYYVAYKTEENEDTFNPEDFSLYEETDKYDIHKMEKFLIYYEGMENGEDSIYVTQSWDMIWSDYEMSKFKESYDKDGNLIVSWGGVFDEQLAIEQIDLPDGSIAKHNRLDGKVYKEGDIDDGYIFNTATGLYENSKGDTLNPDDFTYRNEEWKKTLKDYTSSLENAAIIIEDFTDFINNTTKEIAQLTALFNAYLSHIPRVFKNLITFTLISFILMRILRRD